MTILAMMVVITGFLASAQPAQAYRTNLCTGYGSVYHTHAGPPKYWMYTYSYRSGGSNYDEYWNWSSPTGWVYKGWNWC